MDGGDQRERILETTRALLQADEPAVTVGRVAAAARVSRTTLYRYFPSKAALLQAAGAASGVPAAVDSRGRILEAALDLFAERGVHAATLADIAARAGLSLSGLHWHYRNKDELVADIGSYIPVMPALAAEARLAGAEGAELETQLTHIADAILEVLHERPGLLRLLVCEAHIYPDVARLAIAHTIGRGLPLLARLFEQHEQAGKLRPGSAQIRAQAFMGMFASLALLRPAFASLLAPDDRESAREYVRIMLRGVLRDPSALW